MIKKFVLVSVMSLVLGLSVHAALSPREKCLLNCARQGVSDEKCDKICEL